MESSAWVPLRENSNSPPFHNIPEENLVKISTSENSIHAGVVAKFTFGKFELHPMLGIGVGRRISSDMRLDYYNGSNTDIVQYNVNYGSRWAPFLAPGVKATFRTGRNFMLYAGLEYDWRFTGKPTAEISVNDGYTGELIIPKIKVPTRSPLLINLGISLFFAR